MLQLNFKRIIAGFWFLWWLIAFLTDFLGGMKHLGWLQWSWVPDSNYPFLMKSLAIYHVPVWIPAAFFVAIIIWSGICAFLFLYAFFSKHFLKAAKLAFYISLSLWFAFFIADQIIMNFDLEQNHMVQGGFELLTFLALFIIPG